MGMTVGELTAYLKLDDKDFNQGVDKAEGKFGKMGGALKTAVLGATVAAGAAVAGFAKHAVEVAADFEKGMSDIAAVTGSTGEEMEQLREIALKLGADTAFSAGEAAAGISELAKAGVEVSDIMGGGVKGTLDLAAAGGLEVAEAATIASNAMNQFGLEGKDVASVADALAMAANVSSADVTDLGQALSMCGTVTAQAGWSFQETSAALATLANQGMQGSDAGTSLKQMLMKLQAPSEKAAEVIDGLGISVYDSEGQMRSAKDVIAQFAKSTDGLSDKERDFALATIFGSDAVRAANILINEGATAFGEMTAKVSEAGTAQEMAKTKMDNFEGSMEQLKGSLETLMITIGTPLMNALRPIVDWATVVVNKITEVIGGVGNLGFSFAGLGDALAMLNPIMGLFKEFWPKLVPLFDQVIVIVSELATAVLPILSQAWQMVIDIVAPILDALLGVVMDIFPAILDTIKVVMEALVPLIQPILDFIKKLWDEHGTDILKIVTTVFEAIGPVIEAVMKIIQGIIKIWTGLISGDWSTVWSGIKTYVSGIWDAIKSIIKLAWEAIKGIFKIAGEVLAAAWEILWTGIKTVVQGIWNTIKGAFQGLWDAMKGIWNTAAEWIGAIPGKIKDFFVGAGKWLYEIGKQIIQGLWDGLKEKWESVKNWFKSVGNAIKDFFTGQMASADEVIASGAAQLRAQHGYATGGLVTGAPGAPQLATVHGGEYVLTQGDTSLMKDLIAAVGSGRGGGGVTVNIYGMSHDTAETLSNRVLFDLARVGAI